MLMRNIVNYAGTSFAGYMQQKLKEEILYRKEQIIMSEKRLDAKNRWRNVVVAFRMSPEEAQELNVKVSLSGLSKQDYIIQCLLKHEIRCVTSLMWVTWSTMPMRATTR